MDWDTVVFNTCAFIASLFLLEFGADKFIDHTAAAARRLNISQTLIALLTAGAEWEELAVIVAANAQNRSSLALGNVIGSCVANVLGAFSLGLIFYPTGKVQFDRSSKIYTGLLLALTTVFAALAAILKSIGRIVGWILITTFVVYMVGIGYSIYKGVMTPPEDESDSDSDSDFDIEYSSDSGKEARDMGKVARRSADHGNANAVEDADSGSNEGLLPSHRTSKFSIQVAKRPKRSLAYHISYLILGLIALLISGYTLSHSVSTIGDAIGIHETVLGVTILSFATTLPEKFVAILSGARGHGGLVVANTAGSNIFLLTLCAGLLFSTATSIEGLASSLTVFDVVALWFSSLALFLITVFGGQRWMGVGLFLTYIGFVVFEFAI